MQGRECVSSKAVLGRLHIYMETVKAAPTITEIYSGRIEDLHMRPKTSELLEKSTSGCRYRPSLSEEVSYILLLKK